jgi:glyoxylase-like metal-dependent hydrolase (beta-lactamase superfamily II)
MTIEQIRTAFDNFSYVIYCSKTLEASIVDPSYDSSKALNFISFKKLNLKYIILTHYHSDHTADTLKIKESFPKVKIISSKSDGEKLGFDVNIYVSDNEELKLGIINLKFILTPGHTQGGICILVDNKAIITGDTLFIGDCGRTDLPGGNLEQMFNTLQEKIKSLPDNLIIYPGHDYGPKKFDTLGNQKKTNKVLLAKNLDEFSKIS